MSINNRQTTGGFRVLVIDDSLTMRAVCQQSLREAGFEVEVAESAEAGYQRLVEALALGVSFDGLLLDWILPGMSGAELLEQINGEARFSALSVMIFTESPDESAYQLAGQRSNNDIQHKEDLSLLPYRMQKFLTTYSEQRGIGFGWDQSLSQDHDLFEGKILFVDDSATVRAKYKHLLLANGYQVTTASSMQDALNRVREESFQLAIVDYFMPEGNGDELCRRLLSSPKGKNITVVMHSQSKEVVEESLDAGAIDLIWKDDPANIFLMRISSITRSLRIQRQAEQLDILQSATHVLDVGVLLLVDGNYESFNPTMSHFAKECGGLAQFSEKREREEPLELIDQFGKRRIFKRPEFV
jgi:CheY-like chemotaxis protein